MEAFAHAVELFGSISATSDKTRAESSGQIESSGSRPCQYRNERDKNLSGEPWHATRTESCSVMVRTESTADKTSLGRDINDRSAAATKYNFTACVNVKRQRFSCQSCRDARTKSAVDETFTAFAPYASICHSYAAKFDAHTQ